LLLGGHKICKELAKGGIAKNGHENRLEGMNQEWMPKLAAMKQYLVSLPVIAGYSQSRRIKV